MSTLATVNKWKKQKKQSRDPFEGIDRQTATLHLMKQLETPYKLDKKKVVPVDPQKYHSFKCLYPRCKHVATFLKGCGWTNPFGHIKTHYKDKCAVVQAIDDAKETRQKKELTLRDFAVTGKKGNAQQATHVKA